MQVGLSYIREGDLFVAVTIANPQGQILCEGFDSDMARHYAALLIQCAEKLDEHYSDKKGDV